MITKFTCKFNLKDLIGLCLEKVSFDNDINEQDLCAVVLKDKDGNNTITVTGEREDVL